MKLKIPFLPKFLFLVLIYFFGGLSIFSESELPVNGKLTIAVIGSSKKISSEIESELVNTNFLQVVDRKNTAKLLNEVKLGQMGILKEGSYSQAGEILGVLYLVAVEDSGNYKLIHSSSGRVLGSWNGDSKKNKEQLLSVLESELCILEFVHLDEKRKSKELRIEVNSVSAHKDIGGAKYDDEITCDFKIVSRKRKIKEAYITIMVFTSDGTMIQVFPNKYQPDNKFPTNKEFKFPPKNAPKKFKLIAAPPAGEDTMIIMVSNEAVPFPEKNFLSAGNFKFMEKNKVEGVKGVKVKFDTSDLIYDIERVPLLIKEK